MTTLRLQLISRTLEISQVPASNSYKSCLENTSLKPSAVLTPSEILRCSMAASATSRIFLRPRPGLFKNNYCSCPPKLSHGRLQKSAIWYGTTIFQISLTNLQQKHSAHNQKTLSRSSSPTKLSPLYRPSRLSRVLFFTKCR